MCVMFSKESEDYLAQNELFFVELKKKKEIIFYSIIFCLFRRKDVKFLLYVI